ncbi:MAG: HAMP domain-containing protein [Proteobacteria bacterium]|nr:HAMP domain-containing protein [Pseudomonadota bacterium]MBU1688971.1 HAMP domain-containing protein [Pseudomonadota bacterium]
MPINHKKLGSYIIAAFFLNIFAIMSVGAVCITLVADMAGNIRELRIESDDVFKADALNNKVFQIIYAIDQAIIKKDPYPLNYGRAIIDDVVNETATFIREREGIDHDDKEMIKVKEVLPMLRQIAVLVDRLIEEGPAIDGFSQDTLDTLDTLSSKAQSLLDELRNYHAPIITTLVADSYEKMRSILILYLLSSGIGILASIVGYVILTRNTVTPIIHLAHATKQVAKGDLSVRVSTHSETEIGALYQSFNTMAERLEDHAKWRDDFERELAREVDARTHELKESNEILRNTQSDLVRMEKIATMGQIAASVNHEIKTPLNSLYLNLQLLTRKINKYDWGENKTRDGLLTLTGIIDNEISRISEILEEFVLYARFAPPDLKQDEVNSLLRNLGEMIGENARKGGVDLRLELDEGLPPVMIDRKKLIQALLNLSVNSIHAMPEGGTLTLKSSGDKTTQTIKIIDTGSGILEEDLTHIFEPFFTKKEKGTGFGLAIVKRIVEDHKGMITCESFPREYTCFTITLPQLS